MELVLASQSKDRKACFDRIGVEIIVIPSNIDEESLFDSDPVQLIKKIAKKKANAVLSSWNSNYAKIKGDAIIIAADTMGLYQNELIGKPKDYQEAVEIMQKLAGRTHSVYTAVSMIHSRTLHQENLVNLSKVHFQSLSLSEIYDYLEKSHGYLNRAAAYSIIDHASMIIDYIEGSFTNIIGLPMAQVRLMLKKFGIQLLG